MFWILTIMFIISVAWLFIMMKDLADNGLAEIMMRAFFILITLSLIYYKYVSITATVRGGFVSPDRFNSSNFGNTDSDSIFYNLFN